MEQPLVWKLRLTVPIHVFIFALSNRVWLEAHMKFKIVTLLVVAAWLGMACSTAALAGAADQPVVVDVRTADEFAQNHLVGAMNLDFKAVDFSEQIQKLDKSGSYRLYCRTGNRSAQAAELMKTLGFGDVQSVGGLQEAAAKLQLQCTAKQGCRDGDPRQTVTGR
jgi:rhodanese-related sulfurtransferase